MNCKKCGTENSEESQFCSKCGNNLKVKKKFINNIFSLLALVCFITLFFDFTNLIYLFLSLIGSFVFSIMGIVKSSKVKKKIGKRKGLAMSIVILVLTSILILSVLIITIINVPVTDYNSLNNIEKIAYNGVKSLYYSASDEENLEVNSIYYQQITTDTESYYIIYINFTGKNAFNGTVKNCYKYTSGHSITSLNGGTVSKQWLTSFGTKLDTDKIMQVYNSSQ